MSVTLDLMNSFFDECDEEIALALYLTISFFESACARFDDEEIALAIAVL